MGSSQTIKKEMQTELEWWKSLGSDKLIFFIKKALQNNPGLNAAEANLRQSQELYNAKSGSTSYPKIGINFQGDTQRQNSTTYNANTNLSYIFDISGGNERILEGLIAKSDYYKYQLEGMRLTLAADVAINIVKQANLSEQIKILNSILELQNKQVNLAQKRIDIGKSDKDEVLTFQIKLEQTRTNLPILKNMLQQEHHQLSTFIGESPSTLKPIFIKLNDFILPEKLPFIIPSKLIRTRPDILAAEALIHVTNAEYGVTVSKLYPQLTLNADIGSSALSPKTLFNSSSIIWNLVAQLTAPLFDKGLSAEKRASLAAFDAAVANYKVVVLEALRDVANTLRMLENEHNRFSSLSKVNGSYNQSLKIIGYKYKFGSIDYLEFLLAEEELQKSKMDLLDSKTKKLINSIALYQSLGIK